jgi:amino acid transporter
MVDAPLEARATPTAGGDADVARLHELGYHQELKRGLRAFDNVAMGIAAISPVVALYGVVGIGLTLAGPAWVWVLPAALAGQCLVLVVYSELASEFPIANASYQWSRRLIGVGYGWFNGWVGLCAYAVANTTIAYLGAPWALTLLGIDAGPGAIVVAGAVFVTVCSIVNAQGLDALKLAVKIGIGAECICSIGIAVVLLIGYRQQSAGVLTDTFGAAAISSGSTGAGLVAALAVGGWVFIGFDACGLTAEETKSAARNVPRAVWAALLSVGAIVILNAFALVLAHPRLSDAVHGADADPVTTAVVSSFGGWVTRYFAAATLIAFLCCGMVAQGITARAIYSVARDGVLPASRLLSSVGRGQVPLAALGATTVIAWAGLLLGLETTAIGTLIAFGTAGIYVTFLLVVTAALVARLRGTWQPAGHLRLGRAGLVWNVLAVAWLIFESVNIAWPRSSIAPPGARWYQVWAAPLLLAVVAAVGLGYLAVARPHHRPAVPRSQN